MKFNEFDTIRAQRDAGDPMLDGIYSGKMTDRERHLIGIAVALTKGCVDCTAARIAKAKSIGIEECIIKEVINLVAGINSGFIITTAIKSVQKIKDEKTYTCGCSK
jgi:AhpD family alkylhydroperoxidase